MSCLSRSASSGLWLCAGDLLWEIQHSPFHQRHQHSLFGHHLQGFFSTYWMLEQVTACVSRAASWGHQGLSHSCLLQSTQQLSPGFPRGSHHCILVPLLPGYPRVPAGWHWDQSCLGPLGHQPMNKKGPSTFCICIQAAGEEEEEEAAECRWFFLLPGSYLISVPVCGKKPCWDLGKRGRNEDQQGQGSPALAPGAVLVGWGCQSAGCFAASLFPPWQSLCPPMVSVRQDPGPCCGPLLCHRAGEEQLPTALQALG